MGDEVWISKKAMKRNEKCYEKFNSKKSISFDFLEFVKNIGLAVVGVLRILSVDRVPVIST